MLTITELFAKTRKIADAKKWDKVFIMVDVHETILESDYVNDSENFTYYDKSIEALKRLSDNPFYELILWTSCDDDRAFQYLNEFEKFGIEFSYFNSNPEVQNTTYARFESKFYFNIILDDKAGFDALSDWQEIIEYLDFEEDFQKKQKVIHYAKKVHERLRGVVSLVQIHEVLENLESVKLDE